MSDSRAEHYASSARSGDPATDVIQRAYKLWAPVYDLVCGRLFLSSRRRAAAMAQTNSRRILEIGVGTGLSLGDYGSRAEVWGIDLSPDMIQKARKRANGHRLAVMDAQDLTFEDSAFDSVVAQFLITLVGDPERVLDECRRVVAPGGQIILVNHFYSETGVAAWLERRLASAAHSVGLRPDFPFGRIEAWVAAQPDMTIEARLPSGPFGVFSIVRLRRAAKPASLA